MDEWAGYRRIGAEESVRANRTWWDGAAADYLADHGDFLGGPFGARFVWGPEGLDEARAHLLGEVGGRTVLEVGCGAGQCTHWLSGQGARAVGVDLSSGMLDSGRHRIDDVATTDPDRARRTASVAFVHADARRLPFADASFDLACSAYGAVPFVGDPERIMTEVARVLRPGGRWVFSIPHPARWVFPDDPGPEGLTVVRSYFDTSAYAEIGPGGALAYAEHHRTLGQRVRDVVAAGLELLDLVEPEWPQDHQLVWGGWSPLRGRLIPGTAVFVTRKAA